MCLATGVLHGGESAVGLFEEAVEVLPGKVNVDSRLRYEVFDQEGGLDVDGISHRIRYGFLTKEAGGIQCMVEGETLYAWGHGRDLHPADNAGQGTDLNQLWVSFRSGEGVSGKVGRQIYTLDDHRFIGHVGWRQNIQTFDAATGEVSLSEKIQLKAFYIDAVNSVTGAHNEVESWGLNGSTRVGEGLTVTGFLYSHDGQPDAPAGSANTAGIRITWEVVVDKMVASYALSYARQWEISGFPGKPFGHDYWSLSTKLEVDSWTIGAGYELLGGNGIHGFTTALATLHKFNGFADVFLAASATGALVNGLQDYHLDAGYLIPLGNGLHVSAIYHWFRSLRESTAYGNEVDLVASYAFNKNWSALGKYGRYSSRGGSGGVGTRDKEMLTLEVNFIY